MKRRDLIRKLEKAGYRRDRKSDHIIYEKEGCRSVQVPHKREVNEITAKSILRQAGLK